MIGRGGGKKETECPRLGLLSPQSLGGVPSSFFSVTCTCVGLSVWAAVEKGSDIAVPLGSGTVTDKEFCSQFQEQPHSDNFWQNTEPQKRQATAKPRERESHRPRICQAS